MGRPFASARTCNFEFSPPFVRPIRRPRPPFEPPDSTPSGAPSRGSRRSSGLSILGLRGQLGHDRGEHAHPAPPLPTVVKCLWRTVGRRRMLPHQPIALYEDNPAQNSPVIDPRLATGLRKIRSQSVNLRFGQPEKIVHHASPLWELESRRKRSIKHIYGS
jgi:hypothetical protein